MWNITQKKTIKKIEIQDYFKEAVESKKVLKVHIMLKDIILYDPTNEMFRAYEQYAISKMGNIYVKHDGEVLNYDPSSWNKDYMTEQMVKVVNNFSKERVDLLKKMVAFLYKDKAEQIRKEYKRK